MINKIRDKLSRFRSELHLGRYSKAIIEGELLLSMFKQLNNCKFQLDNHEEIQKHIQQELKIARGLQELIHASPNEKEKMISEQGLKIQPKSVSIVNGETISKPKSENNIEVKVGKWNKKSQIKGSPQKKMSQTDAFRSSKLAFSNVSLQFEPQKRDNEQQQPSQPGLQQDQYQIIQREVILPLNLPQFFKNKQPHRLIICHYNRCHSLIKILKEEITRKKLFTELQQLKLWAPLPKQQILRVYLAPFDSSQTKLVCNILEDQNVILVLYSDIDRQLLTERFLNVKKQGFCLKF